MFVRGDRDTVHVNIIRLLDLLRSAGFYKIAFEIKSEAVKGFPAPGAAGCTVIFMAKPLLYRPPPRWHFWAALGGGHDHIGAVGRGRMKQRRAAGQSIFRRFPRRW